MAKIYLARVALSKENSPLMMSGQPLEIYAWHTAFTKISQSLPNKYINSKDIILKRNMYHIL